MQRSTSNQRNPYTRSGVAGYKTPGGKKPSRWPQLLKRLALYMVIAAIVVVGFYVVRSLIGQSGGPVRINAKPTDNIQAFGDSILYYDGVTLHCINTSGGSKWAYSLGSGANFSCSDNKVVAWTSSLIHVLDKDGRPTYTDRLEGNIRFARIGGTYIAVCMGDEVGSTVRVFTHTGALVENLTDSFTDLYLLDMGFFQSGGQLLWVLGLDIGSTIPISNLSAYEPGKSISTGLQELADGLVYRVYTHNNNLMVVDTSQIRTYNYKVVEQNDISPILVYGWAVKQTMSIGRNTHVLLEQMPQSNASNLFSELRVVTNYTPLSLRLHSPCFASGLTEKGVYAFSTAAIYYAPYGSTTVKTLPLNYQLTGFICTLQNGHAVVVSGSDVMIIALGT